MEISRLGVQLALWLLAYATATATLDLSHVCDPHHSSQQHQSLNPLSKVEPATSWLLVGFISAVPPRELLFLFLIFFLIFTTFLSLSLSQNKSFLKKAKLKQFIALLGYDIYYLYLVEIINLSIPLAPPTHNQEGNEATDFGAHS